MRTCASTNSHEQMNRSGKIDRTCEESLRALKKAGFQVADLCLCSFARGEYALTQPDWREWAQNLRKVGDEIGLPLERAHAPFYGLREDGTEDPHDREMMERAIEVAHICGVKWMVFHPFQVEADGWYSYQKSKELNMKYFREYAALCRPYGVHIAIENMVGNKNRGRRYCSGADELIDLVDSLDDPIFGICWDFGHAHLNGIDQVQALRKIGKRLHCVHVDDNNGIFDDHYAPFMGTIPWVPIMKTIKEIEYDGDWTYEIHGFHLGYPLELQQMLLDFSCRLNEYMIKLAE